MDNLIFCETCKILFKNETELSLRENIDGSIDSVCPKCNLNECLIPIEGGV